MLLGDVITLHTVSLSRSGDPPRFRAPNVHTDEPNIWFMCGRRQLSVVAHKLLSAMNVDHLELVKLSPVQEWSWRSFTHQHVRH